MEDRPLVVVKKGEYTGLDRREQLIDMSSVETTDLAEEGKKKLEDYKEVKSIEGIVYQIPNMEYEIDWNLGDIVTIETEGYTEDKRITEIREIYERDRREIEVTFGDKIPELAEQLQKITSKGVR